MFEANWSLEFALFTSLLDVIQTQLDARKFALVFDLFGTFGTMRKGLCVWVRVERFISNFTCLIQYSPLQAFTPTN